MKTGQIVEHLTEICSKLGIQVRFEPLASSGGLCDLRGKKMLFVGTACSSTEQITTLCEALMDEDLESVYILPEIREIIERECSRIAIQRGRRAAGE